MPHTGATHVQPPPFLSKGAPAGYATPDKINAPTFTNPPFKGLGGTTAPIPSDGMIQRGYMRLLTEVFEYGAKGTPIGDVGGALSHDLGTKLDFQFNPAELTRSVVARTDTQLWINQSPSQLLQPGIGDMSFSWQMLFNREAEVQKGKVVLRASASDYEGVQSRLDRFSKEHSASSDIAAEELGVLADIAILDRITGQSISAEAIAYAQARYDRLVASGAITEEDAVDEENSIVALAEEASVSLMDANVQNSAFLVPNPIRVVFSENFMVDGYVNSVTVSFKKFSTQMVPTVALVDVSMHAIYQGFSRYKSTFTTLLDLSQTEVDTADVEAAEVGTSVATLQDAGRDTPVLGGFDHSPPTDNKITDWGWTSTDTVPGDPETKLEMHKHDADKGSQTVDSQIAKAFTIEKGISFGTLSSMQDGTKLSEALKKQYQSGNLSIPDLSATTSTGLRLHARLRPYQPPSGSGSLTTGALAMAALMSGGDDGFADHERDSVFFGKWPLAQRQLLLGSGDGFSTTLGRNTHRRQSRYLVDFDAFEAQDKSTRSFPITACESGSGILPSDTYGDLLGMHTTEYAPGEVNINDDWLWLEWRDRDHVRKWKEEDTLYYVGKGFYASADAESFPSEITILASNDGTWSGDTQHNLVFKVDYQMHLLFRTQLNYQGLLISDTGWRRIHSRSKNTEFFPEGGWTQKKMRLDTQGNLVGNTNLTYTLDNVFPWQHDQRETKQHFDGHVAGDGCTKWSQQETSAAALGRHYDVDEISVYISSDPNNTKGYI